MDKEDEKGEFGVKALFPNAGVDKRKQKSVKKIQAPPTGILSKKNRVLQSISRIQNTPESKNNDKSQKDNILKAIGLIKDQQQEKQQTYNSKNNRKMILQ